MFTSSRERRYWIYACAVVVAIYLSLGITPFVSQFLRDTGLLGPAFVAGLLLIIAAVVAAAFKARLRGLEIAVLLGIVAAYLLLLVRIEILEERSHILEYGVVAIFVYEALAERARDTGRAWTIPLAAIVVAGVFGVIDELLQSLIPNRTFDLRDIGFNLAAAGVAVTARVLLDWARRRTLRSAQGD